MTSRARSTSRVAERGQTSAELLGILLIAGAIVAAVAATPVAANIAGRTKQLVCRIGGQQCTFTPRLLRHGPSVPGGPLVQGPPIRGGRRLGVLPFPGRITVRCTGRPGRKTCAPPGGSGVRVEISGETTVSRTPTTLDESGCPHQTLSVTSTLKLTGSGTYENARAGETLSRYFAHATTYSVTVTPDDADLLASHQVDPPNPVDPRSLIPGQSIQLTKESYDGLGLGGNYRALQLELGYDTGTRVSSGITRLDASTVRIYVGDEAFVRQAIALGVDLKNVNVGFGASQDLSHGKLHAIDVNIDTAAGWSAYQAFLTSGRLPRPQGSAVLNPTTADTITYTGDSDVHASGGVVDISLPLGSAEGHITTTHNADGTVSNVSFARYNDVGVAKTTRTDASGRPIGTPVRSLLLHDVDPSLVAGLYHVVGQTAPAGSGGDLRLDFSEAQLRQLQQYARNVADQPHGKLVNDLVAARTPDDMLLALYHAGISADAVLNELDILMSPQRATRLPGTIVNPSC